MDEIIKWLIKIEHLASNIYSKAATYFDGNQKLKDFLVRAAEDEAWHYHAVASAAQHYQTRGLPAQSIAVDDETQEKIERIFARISSEIDDKTLSEERVLDLLIQAEFSEWNDIFVYLMAYLKEEVDEFKYVVAKIQNHKRFIEVFLEGSSHGKELLRRMKDIPAVWTENILVVDDEEMVSELVRAILFRDGAIDIASNGQAALQKIQDKYYRLIISDVDMPVMDGLSFFRHAVEEFTTIKDRFLFITGDLTPDRQAFFAQHELRYLLKPVPMNVLRKEALRVLLEQEGSQVVASVYEEISKNANNRLLEG